MKSDGKFTYRANITIPSLNSGLSNIVQNQLSQDELEHLKVRSGDYVISKK